MSNTDFNRGLILFFRVAMGWTFLYAGVTQIIDPHFTVAGFLGTTKTFHSFYGWFASPGMAPVTNILVPWGHLLIGLALVTGLMVRVSGAFGILLFILYYFAHMDFPYIENHFNFIMDYHLVYAAATAYVMVARGGEIFGIDGWLKHQTIVEVPPALKPLLG
jgi:thiosulfate dehydrogenase [quinone] large subunit